MYSSLSKSPRKTTACRHPIANISIWSAITGVYGGMYHKTTGCLAITNSNANYFLALPGTFTSTLPLGYLPVALLRRSTLDYYEYEH